MTPPMYSYSSKAKELQADASFLDAVDAPLLELHKSNILKLEVDELLDECRLDIQNVSWASHVHDYVGLLSNVLKKLPDTPVKKDDCPFVLQSQKVTLVEIPKDLKLVPCGPYAINALTKKAGNANVMPTLDCAVVVKDSYWHQKDYLNHRYMDKRNIILWSIAKLFNGKKIKKHVGTVEWRHFNGNRCVPALILTPPPEKQRKGKSARFRVQLVMSMESLDWIPAPRMFPNRSNIKGGRATPYYNSILARDAFWTEAASLISEDLADLPHFRDTLILVKVWCLQRGFLRGHDSFDEMQIGVLLLYLYRSKRASPRMHPLQVFTVLMKFFAEELTTGKAFCVPNQGKSEALTIASCSNAKLYAKQAKESPVDPVNGDPLSLVLCYEKASTSGAILLNPTMLGNYLGMLSPVFCESVTLQARKTIDCLASTRCFSALFMINARFWTCMDAYFQVPLKNIGWKGAKLWGKELHDVGEVECLSRDLVSILKNALGDRVTEVRVLTNGNGHGVGCGEQIPTYEVGLNSDSANSFCTSMATDNIVVGLKINVENCHRAVDRGPPADDAEGVKAFVDLWGNAAELRRFKDGAIVHAAVWNSPSETEGYVVFEGDERYQGGIVERIVQHVIERHFYRDGKSRPQFLLREMLTMVDGVRSSSTNPIHKLMANSTFAHRSTLNAFDSLVAFLRRNSEQSGPLESGARSKLGLPLQIDAVEPLSPSLRYSSVFPPIPHIMLGSDGKRAGKAAGEISTAPIQIQIRFGKSSKWPTDLKAMGAAKTAMLAQLAEGINALTARGGSSGFEGPMLVTPNHLTFGYLGYSWRVLVRADPELHLLRGLRKPTVDAARLLRILTRESVTASSHHATIHAVHTLYPSAGHVVRLLSQWLAVHLLSCLIPFEAVELLVAHVYSDPESPLDAPSTVVAGFMRVLRLIASYDWVRNPLVVDPQGHLTDDDRSKVRARFHEDRGGDFDKGPPMYIVAPYDCRDLISEESNDGEKINKSSPDEGLASWRPAFTQTTPERVTLIRTATLAKRSCDFLLRCLAGSENDKWTAAFRETQASLTSFSLLLRVERNFVVDTSYSSTGEQTNFRKSNEGQLETIFSRSMRNQNDGIKALRRKVYRNLNNAEPQIPLHNWNPLGEAVRTLSHKMGRYALFFYNEFSPEVIAVLFRPSSFEPQMFTAVHSESVRPAEDIRLKRNSLATINVLDLMRELKHITKDLVVDMKILDKRLYIRRVEERSKSKKRSSEMIADSDSDDGSD